MEPLCEGKLKVIERLVVSEMLNSNDVKDVVVNLTQDEGALLASVILTYKSVGGLLSPEKNILFDG
jgi:hypothetical protein